MQHASIGIAAKQAAFEARRCPSHVATGDGGRGALAVLGSLRCTHLDRMFQLLV